MIASWLEEQGVVLRAEHARQAPRVGGGLRARPTSRRASPRLSAHIEVERPGELVGIDCFYVGRLRGTRGAIWQLTAIDVYSSLRLGRAR